MLIEAKKDGSGIRIAALAPGGAAEASNLLRVGDELVAVDGHSVKGRPTAHASTYITGATGVPGKEMVHLSLIRIKHKPDEIQTRDLMVQSMKAPTFPWQSEKII